MIIAGAKGFAKELLEVLYRDFRYNEIMFYDDVNQNLPEELYGRFKILKTKEELKAALKKERLFRTWELEFQKSGTSFISFLLTTEASSRQSFPISLQLAVLIPK